MILTDSKQIIPYQNQLFREIAEQKTNKLFDLLGGILRVANSDHYIAELHTKEILRRLHKPIYYNSIFKTSFCNPFRYAQLIFMIAKITHKFIGPNYDSLKLKRNLIQISGVYATMLKIQIIPQTNLPFVFDVRCLIIGYMLKEGGKNDLFSRVRAVFYAYKPEEIYETIKCISKDDFSVLTYGETGQEKANRNEFEKIWNAIPDFSTLNSLSIFTIIDLNVIAPRITHYDSKFFKNRLFEEMTILQTFPNLTSANLDPTFIEGLLFPKKILKLQIKDRSKWERMGNRLDYRQIVYFKKNFTNIESLKIRRYYKFFNFLPYPQNLKKLSFSGSSSPKALPDFFLIRLNSIVSLKVSCRKVVKLSCLPNPSAIKHLNCYHCTMTEGTFAKFINLESFTLPRSPQEQSKVIPFLPTAHKLIKLTFCFFHPMILKDFPVCQTIKTIKFLDHLLSYEPKFFRNALKKQNFFDLINNCCNLIVSRFPTLTKIKSKRNIHFNEIFKQKMFLNNIEIDITHST